MGNVNSLSEIIGFNSSFRTAINLYLNLNSADKINSYIPTKSSLTFMDDYLSAVLDNREQATLLVGPYGKGKSHLLLVLLAVLSMPRTAENKKIINNLIEKIGTEDELGKTIVADIKEVWSDKKFLPVLITDTTGDLNQGFLCGLNDALKRDGLAELCPDTYYSIALSRIEEWANDYPETYKNFKREISNYGLSISKLKTDLKLYSKEALQVFKTVYPKITAGSEFNPLAVSEVLPLYKSTSEKLVEEYGYSGIYIVFDEFSKFIESQDGFAAGANMRLIQDICELATDSGNSQIFFTMVAHKSIKEYGKYLSQDIINSFTGIEGRIIEKYFITSSKNNYELIKNAIVKDYKQLELTQQCTQFISDNALSEFYQLPAFKSNFLLNEFDSIVLKGCYPLNPIAAYLLLNVSEKVAQNERTLFTFISNDEPNSMARFVSEHTPDGAWSIGADLIYDYFSPLFKKDVANEFIHNIWLSSEYALERATTDDQKKLVKALAIILIVNKEDEIPASQTYLSLSLFGAVGDSIQAINELNEKGFIYRKNATGSYVFKTRAGSELKAEIKRQREIKGENVDYPKALLEITGRYHIVPRRYNTLNSMTRFFNHEFMLAEDFVNINSADAIMSDCSGDGKVITLFSFSNIKQDQIKKHLLMLNDPRLVVVCPKKKLGAQKQLRDYEIIQELKANQTFTSDNAILKRELPLLVEDLSVELERVLADVYEDDPDTLVLFFENGKVKNAKVGNVETAVNKSCEAVYVRTPQINNEMVNRSVIGSSQTKKSRLSIIQTILAHQDTPDYYEGTNQEASIYRALFCVTGIVNRECRGGLSEIIEEINSYVDSCSDKKQPISTLINKLKNAPYGMRLGVMPFYLAHVLSERREDIIIYFADKELQLTPDIIVNMCEQPEDYSVYVSKEDIEKEKYISALNELFQVGDNRNLSTNRIKDIFICMQRWFRALPQVSRNAVDLERYVKNPQINRAMQEIKKAIQKVEFNPFEILFVIFPNSFGDKSLEETYKVIDDCKTYYDDYYDWIMDEAVDQIYSLWDKKKKQELFFTLKEWYEKQSKRSKQGLYDGRMTNLMSLLESLDAYNNNQEMAKKVVKAVTDVYIENWNSGAIEDFSSSLLKVKQEIEAIRDDGSIGELTLSFRGRNGEQISKLYSHADESTGSVLRNIIEEALDEYDDISVNDRVSILLEMIEKIIK